MAAHKAASVCASGDKIGMSSSIPPVTASVSADEYAKSLAQNSRAQEAIRVDACGQVFTFNFNGLGRLDLDEAPHD